MTRWRMWSSVESEGSRVVPIVVPHLVAGPVESPWDRAATSVPDDDRGAPPADEQVRRLHGFGLLRVEASLQRPGDGHQSSISHPLLLGLQDRGIGVVFIVLEEVASCPV